MKDTQGIVSSGTACTSCRNGYALDSRELPWKHRCLTNFKKPSKNMRIPEIWTLNNRDHLCRTTCHESHILLKALKDILGRSVVETGGCGVYHAVYD